MARVDQGEPKAKRDLLAEHPALAAIALAVLAVTLVVFSITAGVSGTLPTIAGGWKLGIEILRAAIAFGVIAILVIVLIRGWGGHWPQRISTTSIDWGSLAVGIEERKRATDTVNEVEAEFEDLRKALVVSEGDGK
jgi:hypothetical protein